MELDNFAQISEESSRRRRNTLNIMLSDATHANEFQADTVTTSRAPTLTTHGQHNTKNHSFFIQIIVFLTSWVLFGIGCLTITPQTHFNFPWRLGFEKQLIIIGLLLSLMKTCLNEIVGLTLMSLQARYANRLQQPSLANRDAVLSRTPLRPKDSGWFYIPLLFLWSLPIGIGVAYKSALGGEASNRYCLSSVLGQIPARPYGLVSLTPDELFVSTGSAPYLMTNATFDFFTNSDHGSTFPSTDDFPKPFGYNLLLLSNKSAAALDLPSFSYLSAIQDSLRGDDTLIMNATVRGFVTQSNMTVERLHMAFWENTIEANELGLTSYSDFDDSSIALGMMPNVPNGHATTSCLVGFYRRTYTRWFDSYDKLDNEEVKEFRHSTLMFTTHRTICTASWRVTRQSLRLQYGHCPTAAAGILRDDGILNRTDSAHFSPFTVDALPIIGRLLSEFPKGKSRADSPWKLSSFAMAVVGSYWARGAYLLPKFVKEGIPEDSKYAPEQETFELTRGVLHPYWWLYVVLGAQPFITGLAFVANYIWPHRVAIRDDERLESHHLLKDIAADAISMVSELRST
ncbi:hypothetical protein CFIO01_02864 [Colletotrichum fioriniae PJ7]|uniref:Uncharacterized protein n=1 Tax=Colletotrichum fioriniae PJ7 TaxID=1445577 RepID=A0A010Q189_9PEZI|nr:hypothetical protein CFIO01_02864 [Colletotrichum fioriniae PJ7]